MTTTATDLRTGSSVLVLDNAQQRVLRGLIGVVSGSIDGGRRQIVFSDGIGSQWVEVEALGQPFTSSCPRGNLADSIHELRTRQEEQVQAAGRARAYFAEQTQITVRQELATKLAVDFGPEFISELHEQGVDGTFVFDGEARVHEPMYVQVDQLKDTIGAYRPFRLVPVNRDGGACTSVEQLRMSTNWKAIMDGHLLGTVSVSEPGSPIARWSLINILAVARDRSIVAEATAEKEAKAAAARVERQTLIIAEDKEAKQLVDAAQRAYEATWWKWPTLDGVPMSITLWRATYRSSDGDTFVTWCTQPIPTERRGLFDFYSELTPDGLRLVRLPEGTVFQEVRVDSINALDYALIDQRTGRGDEATIPGVWVNYAGSVPDETPESHGRTRYPYTRREPESGAPASLYGPTTAIPHKGFQDFAAVQHDLANRTV